jgi:hypothetical protein
MSLRQPAAVPAVRNAGRIAEGKAATPPRERSVEDERALARNIETNLRRRARGVRTAADVPVANA